MIHSSRRTAGPSFGRRTGKLRLPSGFGRAGNELSYTSNMQRFVRAMSTKATSHAPPIKIYGVPGKYAEATYIAASKVSPTFPLILRCDVTQF